MAQGAPTRPCSSHRRPAPRQLLTELWPALQLHAAVESDYLGSVVSEELVPGGSRLAVTNGNVLQYVYLVAGEWLCVCLDGHAWAAWARSSPGQHCPPGPTCAAPCAPAPAPVDWHLNKRLGTAAAAFGRGLSRVIPPAWLRLFSPKEASASRVAGLLCICAGPCILPQEASAWLALSAHPGPPHHAMLLCARRPQVNQLLGGGEAGALDVADMEAHCQVMPVPGAVGRWAGG